MIFDVFSCPGLIFWGELGDFVNTLARTGGKNWSLLSNCVVFARKPLGKNLDLQIFWKISARVRKIALLGLWGGRWLARVVDFQLKMGSQVFNMENENFEVDFRFSGFLLCFGSFRENPQKKMGLGSDGWRRLSISN